MAFDDKRDAGVGHPVNVESSARNLLCQISGIESSQCISFESIGLPPGGVCAAERPVVEPGLQLSHASDRAEGRHADVAGHPRLVATHLRSLGHILVRFCQVWNRWVGG